MKLMRFVLLVLVLSGLAACSCVDEGAVGRSILNRGIGTEPESLDAHKASSNQAADVLRDIGEGLVGYSATGELTSGTAESWAISDDGLSYTFHLRSNARWSNGDAVTAEHFVFSFKRLVDPHTAAFYAQFLDDIAGVAAPDAQTLIISLQQPTPYLLNLLTHPATFPMHPGSVADHGDGFARPGKLLSNGAYVLTEWVPGSVITLRRNEEYWNNANTSIDEVRYHLSVQTVAEYSRYRAGELDITSSVPPESFAEIKQQYGDLLRTNPEQNVYYFGYNLTRPPFKDSPELRQALSMAIDREAIVEKIVGRGEAPAYSWVPPGVYNYEAPVFSYAALKQEERRQIARGLYKAAGYSTDNPLHMELRYNTNDTHRRVALAAQSMWRDVLGFEATLINEEFQVLLANMQAKVVTQVFRSSWAGEYNDAHAFLSVLQSQNAANLPGYKSDEYDALLSRAAEQPDPHRRRLFLEEAERVMLAEHPVIPIYFYVSKHLISARVAGWGDNALDYHYSQHLSLKAVD